MENQQNIEEMIKAITLKPKIEIPTETSPLQIPSQKVLGNPQHKLPVVQYGLVWNQDLEKRLGVMPAWSAEPLKDAVADVSRRQEATKNHCNKPRLAFQGCFNKLYSITSIEENTWFLMRVALPVDPIFKTWSEVSTIALLRSKTTIPIPRVLEYCTSNTKDEIGFEWMLVERSRTAAPLYKRIWHSMSWAAKEKFVEDLGNVVGQLFCVRADSIGSVYQLGKDTASKDAASKDTVSKDTVSCDHQEETLFVVGRLVSQEFFWGNHIHENVPRGPFTSTSDWLQARLQLVIRDCKKAKTPEEQAEGYRTGDIIQRLHNLLPKVFPPGEKEEFALVHGDLHQGNTLVNPDGSLNAILDWECTSTMPLFMASKLPKLFTLYGRRSEKPDVEKYSDSEDPGSKYYDHLKEYELTVLRGTFLKFMRANYPSWVKEHEARMHSIKVQFESAVNFCDAIGYKGESERLLDVMERKLKGQQNSFVST